MFITLNIFKILIVLTAILAKLSFGYENHYCSDFGSWQAGCAGPGTVACEVPYESGAYCISRCYNNACSQSQDAARGFKNSICQSYGYAADYIKADDGEIHLAIHRNKSPTCGTYEREFDFVPYAQWYPETQPTTNNHDKIPK